MNLPSKILFSGMLALFVVDGKARERITDNMKNEAQLLKAAGKLDEKALLEIFDTYAPKVYARALQQGHDPEKADDIVGEVFARLLDELAKGQGPSDHLLTYLYQAADRLVTEQSYS